MIRYGLKVKGAAMLIVLGTFLCARVTPALAQDCLGAALGFSLLSLADDGSVDVGVGNGSKLTTPLCYISGEVGAGSNIALGNNDLTGGDVISYNGSIALNNYATVQGQCVTSQGPGSVTKNVGATCGSIDTSGTNGLLDFLDEAAWDASFFACDVYGGTPTQSIPAINIADGKTFTVTDSVTGGLNFIDVPSLAIGNSATLVLSGGPLDTVVLRVDGNTSIGHGAKIVLTGGLTPFGVVIAAQGGVSSWGNSTTVNGTILVGEPYAEEPDFNCSVGSGATVNGAILCGNNLTVGPNARVNFQPAFAVNVPCACEL
jgi:hypothetical protein